MQLPAQAVDESNSHPLPDLGHLEQVPRVPGMAAIFHGFDAGLSFTAVHDSSIGWYNLATPAISYTLSARFSADASVSIYPYRLAPNSDPMPPPGRTLVSTC